jgi:acyl-CoA thioesterase II
MGLGSVFEVLVNSVLVVDAVGPDEFVGGRPAESFDRIYGGEVAAQGMRAAAATVAAGRAVHSLHVSFLGVGDPQRTVHYTVERLRDSTHFSTRFVRARQGERLIAAMTASFQAPWQGLDHSVRPLTHGEAIPEPESLPRREAAVRATFGQNIPDAAAIGWPIDIRYIDRRPWDTTPPASSPGNRMWVRGDGRLGDDHYDHLDHACLLTYASDLTMFESVLYPYSDRPDLVSWEKLSRFQIRGASLDHSIWFHRPFRADDWLLHEHDSPAGMGARSFTEGRYFDRAGQLVASVAQETAMFVDPAVNLAARAEEQHGLAR